MVGGRGLSRRLAAEVVACAQEMASRGLVVGSVGNVSVRSGDRVLITPSRLPYARMRRKDLVAVSLDGEVRGKSLPPSRELPLHLAVYRRRPDVGALVHTHSPHAVAWSFRGEPLPPTEESAYYGIGEVLTSPPEAAGSIALADTAAASIGDSAAVLLGRHGVLAAGTDPAQALVIALAVEHQAQVALLLDASRSSV